MFSPRSMRFTVSIFIARSKTRYFFLGTSPPPQRTVSYLSCLTLGVHSMLLSPDSRAGSMQYSRELGQRRQMADENQHWVPQFLIRQFADEDGRVFRFDIQTEKVTKPPPKHAASDKGFNEFEINGKSVSFEDHLEKVETRA